MDPAPDEDVRFEILILKSILRNFLQHLRISILLIQLIYFDNRIDGIHDFLARTSITFIFGSPKKYLDVETMNLIFSSFYESGSALSTIYQRYVPKLNG